MKNILIIDVNNWVRVKMAESLGGASIFSLYQEVIANSLAGKLQIFVSDGINSRKKRKEIYPEYKAKRTKPDQSIFDGINFFKELLINAPKNVLRIEIPEWEADDVIANLVEKNLKGVEVGIISTDRDLTALRIHKEVDTLKEPMCEPKWVKLYKILVGDSSDNISGVKGFGDSAWEKLSDEVKDRLTVYLHLEKGKLDADVVRRMLSRENLSDKMREKIVDSVKDGTIYMWYRVVSFMNIPDELLKLESGSGNTWVNDGKINKFEIGW
jgi:5'-3' exonuclease